MMMQPVIAHHDAIPPPQLAAGGAMSVSEQVELMRRGALNRRDQRTKVALGQFFTPAPVASLMASMLECDEPAIHILDAGAGIGSLFAAVQET